MKNKGKYKYVVKWKWIFNIQNDFNIYGILNTCVNIIHRLETMHLSNLIEPYSTKGKTNELSFEYH